MNNIEYINKRIRESDSDEEREMLIKMRTQWEDKLEIEPRGVDRFLVK
jgi:hypothetical protein